MPFEDDTGLFAKLYGTLAFSDPKHREKWIRLSSKFGGATPKSSILISVQQDGQMDMIRRRLDKRKLHEFKVYD